MADQFPGLVLQRDPLILMMRIPGRWLLRHTTPSWRIQDPLQGFQRMVSEKRATTIAASVLAQGRTFPNAIVLATGPVDLNEEGGTFGLPEDIRLLVVDGQHRLWAQNYSDFEADYACIVHFGLSEEEMARLFLEINDNQKRVPSSLRWDLVRLVQPEDDPEGRRSADLVYQLNSDPESALHQRIDLTGEQPEITLKQGSLAPGIKQLLKNRAFPLREIGYEAQYQMLVSYFAAIREHDADGWRSGESPLYQARVIRALLNVLPAMLQQLEKPVIEVSPLDLLRFISRIDLSSLTTAEVRAAQGNAGIAAISKQIRGQVF